MDIAVIKTGGKQYVVKPGMKLKVEKLEAEPGKKVEFAEVLLTANGTGTDVKIGSPRVTGAAVKATVLTQGKSQKVTGYHYKNKTRNKSKFGHRQPFTEVEIQSIA